MKNETIAERLADFVVGTKYTEIPPEVIAFTKHLVLKTVAGMVAGSDQPAGRKMAKIVRNRGLPAEAPVAGHSFRTALWESVFLNAYFAHASELEDDMFDPAGGSGWDITVIPLMLPLAAKLGLSGRRLMESLVVGLEVTCRTGLHRKTHRGIGMFPGSLGSAAAAAKAFELDKDKTIAALGHGLSSSPLAICNLGTDSHFFESALMALQGILAAEAAKEGLTGNPDIDAYMSGILGREETRSASERMAANLGQEWLLRTIWLKKYPCCFVQHRQLDLLLEMLAKHGLRYDDVETVEVHVDRFDHYLDRPNLATASNLQFSFQHSLGSAMLDGDFTLDHLATEMIADQRYAAARAKVKVVLFEDASSPRISAASQPAVLVVRTKDGRVFTGERRYPLGSPAEPLTTEQVKALFHKFTRCVLTEEQARKAVAAIMALEELHDTGEIMVHTGGQSD